jgi:hypothetical protein
MISIYTKSWLNRLSRDPKYEETCAFSLGYEGIDRSELEGLRDLDLGVLARHVMMEEADLGAAVRSFMAYAVEMDGMDLTEEQVVELKRRSRAFDENPDDVMTQEEVLDSIKRRK